MQSDEDDDCEVPEGGMDESQGPSAPVPEVHSTPLLVYDISGPSFVENEINFIAELGRGTQSIVRLATIKVHGKCAVKELGISKGRAGTGATLEDMWGAMQWDKDVPLKRKKMLETTNNTEREFLFTHQVSHHDNVVGFRGFLKKQVKVRGRLMELFTGLIFEYMPGGSVEQWMKERGEDEGRREEKVVKYSLDIARALSFCHEKMNILHRDIKPSNVLLTADGKTAKLADFGIARQNDNELKTHNKGMIKYIAPEVINENQLTKYGFKAEVWSYSMLVFAMAHGRDPFNDDEVNNEQLHLNNLNGGMRPPIDGRVHERIQTIIIDGWKLEPYTRPSMVDMLTRFEGMFEEIQKREPFWRTGM